MRIILLKCLVIFLLFPVVLVNAQDKKESRRHRRNPDPVNMIDKKEATAVFVDATKALLLDDTAKATALFNHCIEMDPTNDAAYYQLAQIYFNRNDFINAARHIEKAIALSPDNQYYRLLSMDIYGKSGRKEDLLNTCLSLVKQFPDNADYKFELATAYLMLEKGEEAIKTYNSIEDELGVTEEVSMQKQRIYMMLNKPEKAIAEINKLLVTFPEESSKYYSMLSEIYMQENKPDVAASYYQKIVETDPDNPYIHISLSDYYRKKGDHTRAIEELKTGFANPALDIDTKIRVLTSYYTANEIYSEKKEEVAGLSEILVRTHPGDAKALSLSAELLLNGKQYAKARDQFRQVLAIDSSKYTVWQSYLQSEALLSDWNGLLKESADAMELFPYQPIPFFYNGMAKLQLKMPAEAIKSLISGEKLVSDNEQLEVQFYTYLGDAYNETRQYSLSDESYEKALRADPENSYVLNNYAFYLSLRGQNLEKALEMARKGASLDSVNPANLDTYGWVFYKLGKYEEAKSWVQKAITLTNNDDPDLLEHFGDILYKLDDHEKALEYWKKALNKGKGSDFLEKKVKEKKLFE